MMIRAYDETYLDDTMPNLGSMLQYAVCDCGQDIDAFFGKFISAKVATQIERGDIKHLCGMSGIELAYETFRFFGDGIPNIEPTIYLGLAPEYWVGWILAYYQWESGLKFSDIVECGLPPSKVLDLYLLHEADKSKFVQVANDIIRRGFAAKESNLKKFRRLCGFTQKELSAQSGVPLRMVQLYEQRRNDINKAQVSTVLALSRALCCDIEDIMEPVVPGEKEEN